MLFHAPARGGQRRRSGFVEDDARRAVAFNPLNIPNLELYLDSRFGVSGATDGNTFQPWLDQSVHGRDASTMGGAPAFVDPTYWITTGANLTPNGLPTVEWGLTTAFPGNALASAAFLWPVMTRGYTFYEYSRVTGKTAGPYPFVNQTVWAGWTGAFVTTPPQLLFDSGTGPAPGRSLGAVDVSGGGNPFQYSQRSTVDNLWRLRTWVWNPPINNTTTIDFYVNNVVQAQVAGPAFGDLGAGPGSQRYSIGGAANGNTVSRCQQGFFIWYSDAHNAATRALFLAWTSALWGLSP